jgi:hypothetical protein
MLTKPHPDCRQIAVVRDMMQLQAALRARAIALNVTGEGLDQECQFPDRYAGKLLAPIPIRAVGGSSLGPLLAALGTELVLVERPDALAAYTSRVQKRVRDASVPMLPTRSRLKRHVCKGDTWWSVEMNARRTLKLSAEKRKRIARNAAWHVGRKRSRQRL